MSRGAWLLLGAIAAGLVALGVAAGWHDVNVARQQLSSAKAVLTDVIHNPTSLRTASGRANASARMDAAIHQTDQAANRLRGSLALSVGKYLPGIGTQRAGVLRLIADGKAAAAVGRRLVNSADHLATETSIRDGQVPLSGLAALQRVVDQSAIRLRALPHSGSGLWGSLRQSRDTFNTLVTSTSVRLSKAGDAIGAIRTFLGEAEDRRYLIAAENNAEMRDQGMVLSYAVADLSHGRISFERSGRIADLALKGPAPVPVPAGTQTLFGDMGPNQLWQSVNATADFAWSGRTMAAMYRQATGQSVDGVIAIDVPGLAAILRVVGPVSAPDVPEPITADNAPRILLNDFYANVPLGSSSARKEQQAEVIAAAIKKLTTGAHDAVDFGRDLGAAASGGHLRLWSLRPDEERVFERTGLGGGPAVSDADRTFHVAVQNVNATKLDYFVLPRVEMRVSITSQGTAVVRTTVTVVNTAPRDAKPSEQFGPNPGNATRAGEYTTRTQLWGPVGATQLESVPESGLQANQETLRVLPSSQGTVTFETIIPNAIRTGLFQLRLVPQSRLFPMDLRIDLDAPGWRVSGDRTIKESWDHTVTVGWKLNH